MLMVTSKVRKRLVFLWIVLKLMEGTPFLSSWGKQSFAYDNSSFSLLVKMCAVLATKRRKRNDL